MFGGGENKKPKEPKPVKRRISCKPRSVMAGQAINKGHTRRATTNIYKSPSPKPMAKRRCVTPGPKSTNNVALKSIQKELRELRVERSNDTSELKKMVNKMQVDALLSHEKLLTKDDLKVFEMNHIEPAEKVDDELDLITKSLSTQLTQLNLLESKEENTAKAIKKLDSEIDTIYEHVDANSENIVSNQAAIILLETHLKESKVEHKSEMKLLQDEVHDLERKLNEQVISCKSNQDSTKSRIEELQASNAHAAPQNTDSTASVGPTSSKPNSQVAGTPHENPLNVIIEGLSEYTGEDLYERVFEMGLEIDINLNEAMFHSIHRLGNHTSRDWPRPIKVELVSRHIRNLLLGRGSMLAYTTDYYKVSIKPDESLHKRVCKAKLRYAARVARQKGLLVRQGADEIVINSIKYPWKEVDLLPKDLCRDEQTHEDKWFVGEKTHLKEVYQPPKPWKCYGKKDYHKNKKMGKTTQMQNKLQWKLRYRLKNNTQLR